MPEYKIDKPLIVTQDLRGQSFNQGLGGEPINPFLASVQGAIAGKQAGANYARTVMASQRENDPEKLAADKLKAQLLNKNLALAVEASMISNKSLDARYNAQIASALAAASVNRANAAKAYQYVEAGGAYAEALGKRGKAAYDFAAAQKLGMEAKLMPYEVGTDLLKQLGKSGGSGEGGIGPFDLPPELTSPSGASEEMPANASPQERLANTLATQLEAFARNQESAQLTSNIAAVHTQNSLLDQEKRKQLNAVTRNTIAKDTYNNKVATGVQTDGIGEQNMDSIIEGTLDLVANLDAAKDDGQRKFISGLIQQSFEDSPLQNSIDYINNSVAPNDPERAKKLLKGMYGAAAKGLPMDQLPKVQQDIRKAGYGLESISDPEAFENNMLDFISDNAANIEDSEFKEVAMNSDYIAAVNTATEHGKYPYTITTEYVDPEQDEAGRANGGRAVVIRVPGKPNKYMRPTADTQEAATVNVLQRVSKKQAQLLGNKARDAQRIGNIRGLRQDIQDAQTTGPQNIATQDQQQNAINQTRRQEAAAQGADLAAGGGQPAPYGQNVKQTPQGPIVVAPDAPTPEGKKEYAKQNPGIKTKINDDVQVEFTEGGAQIIDNKKLHIYGVRNTSVTPEEHAQIKTNKFNDKKVPVSMDDYLKMEENARKVLSDFDSGLGDINKEFQKLAKTTDQEEDVAQTLEDTLKYAKDNNLMHLFGPNGKIALYATKGAAAVAAATPQEQTLLNMFGNLVAQNYIQVARDAGAKAADSVEEKKMYTDAYANPNYTYEFFTKTAKSLKNKNIADREAIKLYQTLRNNWHSLTPGKVEEIVNDYRRNRNSAYLKVADNGLKFKKNENFKTADEFLGFKLPSEREKIDLEPDKEFNMAQGIVNVGQMVAAQAQQASAQAQATQPTTPPIAPGPGGGGPQVPPTEGGVATEQVASPATQQPQEFEPTPTPIGAVADSVATVLKSSGNPDFANRSTQEISQEIQSNLNTYDEAIGMAQRGNKEEATNMAMASGGAIGKGLYDLWKTAEFAWGVSGVTEKMATDTEKRRLEKERAKVPTEIRSIVDKFKDATKNDKGATDFIRKTVQYMAPEVVEEGIRDLRDFQMSFYEEVPTALFGNVSQEQYKKISEAYRQFTKEWKEDYALDHPYLDMLAQGAAMLSITKLFGGAAGRGSAGSATILGEGMGTLRAPAAETLKVAPAAREMLDAAISKGSGLVNSVLNSSPKLQKAMDFITTVGTKATQVIGPSVAEGATFAATSEGEGSLVGETAVGTGVSLATRAVLGAGGALISFFGGKTAAKGLAKRLANEGVEDISETFVKIEDNIANNREPLLGITGRTRRVLEEAVVEAAPKEKVSQQAVARANQRLAAQTSALESVSKVSDLKTQYSKYTSDIVDTAISEGRFSATLDKEVNLKKIADDLVNGTMDKAQSAADSVVKSVGLSKKNLKEVLSKPSDEAVELLTTRNKDLSALDTTLKEIGSAPYKYLENTIPELPNNLGNKAATEISNTFDKAGEDVVKRTLEQVKGNVFKDGIAITDETAIKNSFKFLEELRNNVRRTVQTAEGAEMSQAKTMLGTIDGYLNEALDIAVKGADNPKVFNEIQKSFRNIVNARDTLAVNKGIISKLEGLAGIEKEGVFTSIFGAKGQNYGVIKDMYGREFTDALQSQARAADEAFKILNKTAPGKKITSSLLPEKVQEAYGLLNKNKFFAESLIEKGDEEVISNIHNLLKPKDRSLLADSGLRYVKDKIDEFSTKGVTTFPEGQASYRTILGINNEEYANLIQLLGGKNSEPAKLVKDLLTTTRNTADLVKLYSAYPAKATTGMTRGMEITGPRRLSRDIGVSLDYLRAYTLNLGNKLEAKRIAKTLLSGDEAEIGKLFERTAKYMQKVEGKGPATALGETSGLAKSIILSWFAGRADRQQRALSAYRRQQPQLSPEAEALFTTEVE